MKNITSPLSTFILLAFLLVVLFFINLSIGSVTISLNDTFNAIFGQEVSHTSFEYIIWNYRIPKAVTAILAGSGLALCGLLMQTLFRNPLAGPFVLGISSGASLGAALLIMGLSLFSGSIAFSLSDHLALAIASSLGSFLVLLVVMGVAVKVKDTMSLLIIGLMFGSLTAAIVSILSFLAKAEQLQRYVFWTFGSLGDLSWNQIYILMVMVFVGILVSIRCIKSLNSYLIGENYAKSMGVNLKKSRFTIIAATGLLAGSITAFAGPIAFIGLAVPHLTRQLFNTTDHKILLPAVLINGGIIVLVCDMVAQLPGSVKVLPINAITSLIGAPVVIWLLMRKKNIVF
ncbi:FecCD family ABC transporter permease [Maribacter sp. CXY002]|uniref:FecCD family ABC transporter permease n=1 Tax=Maribacter luteocoastalis TaxID=3407671 RepID=UPI003B678FB3